MDFMEKREDLYKPSPLDISTPIPKSLPPSQCERGTNGIDLYYPWALIFTGRLCDTSAVENPSK
ncbi:MAG: hypothetical protein LBF15_06945 [Candidatus Peribacteria bacterium]|nr:hypothetical protein [Candidatus Peribacteria bacterium]